MMNKRRFLKLSIYIFLFVVFLFISSEVVHAKEYKCGHAPSGSVTNIDWCAVRGSAYTAMLCKEDESLIDNCGLDNFCVDSDKANNAVCDGRGVGRPRVLICKYSDKAQGDTGGAKEGLCCPEKWNGEDADKTHQARCYSDDGRDMCENQNDCDAKASEALVVGEARVEIKRQYCKDSAGDCFAKYTSVFEDVEDKLCYREGTVIIDKVNSVGDLPRLCKGTSWVKALDNCGDGECKEEEGETEENCPTDCPESGPGVPPEDSDKPPPEATCKDLCRGERGEIPGTPPEYSGPNYIACCKCVCGNTDCECSDRGCTFTNHVWTEVGCITPTQEGITAAVMRIFIGVITGIAVIRFIQAGVMFNSDDPEKIAEAKSIFWSAIIALVAGGILPLIMNFIGIDVLGIGEIFGIKRP